MLRYLHAVLYADPGPRRLLRATRAPVLPTPSPPLRVAALPSEAAGDGAAAGEASALTAELVEVAQSWMEVHTGARHVPRNFFSAAVLGDLGSDTTCDVLDRCVGERVWLRAWRTWGGCARAV